VLLEGKTAVVTGAGRGIGKAIAERFLREGARLAGVDVVADRMRATASELGALGEVHALDGDLSDVSVCRRVAADADRLLGGVDVLVNNAAVQRVAPFLDHTEADWDRVMAVNVKSIFLLSQQVARAMIDRGRRGVILNAASTNGSVAERGTAAYNASKGAVVLLTQSMALDLAPHGIRVAGVSPGLAGPTGMALDAGVADIDWDAMDRRVPLGRIAAPAEVAAVYAFLASDLAAHIAGTSVVVDGGLLSRQFGDA
jgi:NAD(P)-dependent dehydrogenase (short-subunit alcohol dehydrogenase family)